MKGAIFFAALLAAVFVFGSRASAYTEYCPADVNIWPVGVEQGQATTLYSVTLSALTPRSVQGTIVLGSGDGKWYSAPFEKERIEPIDVAWKDRYARFTRKEPMSPVVYLRFDSPIVVEHAYLRTGTVSDEKILGWDGDEHACPLDEKPVVRKNRALEMVAGPPGANATPSPASLVLRPHGIVAPGPTDCPKPFEDAKAVSPARPVLLNDFSAANIGQAETFVQVALSETGSVDDAWIWRQSGNDAYDRAALQAAKLSKYSPPRAFCKNTAGMYMFLVEYE